MPLNDWSGRLFPWGTSVSRQNQWCITPPREGSRYRLNAAELANGDNGTVLLEPSVVFLGAYRERIVIGQDEYAPTQDAWRYLRNEYGSECRSRLHAPVWLSGEPFMLVVKGGMVPGVRYAMKAMEGRSVVLMWRRRGRGRQFHYQAGDKVGPAKVFPDMPHWWATEGIILDAEKQ